MTLVRSRPLTPDILVTWHPNDPNLSGRTLTANSAYYFRLQVWDEKVLATIRIRVVTQSGNIKVGQFTFDGTTMSPLWTSNAFALSNANTVEVFTPGSPLRYPSGRSIYLGLAADNATASFNGVNGQSSGLVLGNESMIKASAYSTFDQAQTSLSVTATRIYMAAV